MNLLHSNSKILSIIMKSSVDLKRSYFPMESIKKQAVDLISDSRLDADLHAGNELHRVKSLKSPEKNLSY